VAGSVAKTTALETRTSHGRLFQSRRLGVTGAEV
jgi:hypothetical protein